MGKGVGSPLVAFGVAAFSLVSIGLMLAHPLVVGATAVAVGSVSATLEKISKRRDNGRLPPGVRGGPWFRL